MSHTAFGEFFPEIADKETRVVTIIDQAITGLPPFGNIRMPLF